MLVLSGFRRTFVPEENRSHEKKDDMTSTITSPPGTPELIRSLRTSYGWSQPLLATRLVEAGWEGAGQKTVSQIERGRQNLTAGQLVMLAAALDVSTLDFTSAITDRQRTEEDPHVRRTRIAQLRNALTDVLAAADSPVFASEVTDESGWGELRSALDSMTELSGRLLREIDVKAAGLDSYGDTEVSPGTAQMFKSLARKRALAYTPKTTLARRNAQSEGR